MEKAATAAPKISNKFVPIGMKSIGTRSGVLCVENGPITPAEPVPNSTGSVNQIREHIRNRTAFECDDLDSLVSAIIHEYDAKTWKSKLIWVIGGIRRTVPAVKGMNGSWNFHLRFISDEEVGQNQPYKVFRKRWYVVNDLLLPQFQYEFHEAPVVSRQWLQAEISGSPGLTGLMSKDRGGTGGRFHLLWNKQQAEAYLNKRVNETAWFSLQEAVMVPVEGRAFQTLDLVYIPPKLFVWGIDSEQMYVNL